MIPYGVQSTVVLPSSSPVLAIFFAIHENDSLLFVIQRDMICVLKNDNVLAKFVSSIQMPVSLARHQLVLTKSDSRMLTVIYKNRALHNVTCSFKEKLDCLSSSEGEFYTASGARIHRHDLNDNHQLLRTFAAPVKALASADAKLLVLLPNSLHLLNPLTNQDLVEVASNASSPIHIFWTMSFQHKVWFAAHIRPDPMSTNRRHRLLMAELDETVISKDITPDDIDCNRSLTSRQSGNKLVTLANNGNTLLIHAIEDFGTVKLLYRAEATDITFTAVEILGKSKACTAPTLAVGTSNGAVALFRQLDRPTI